MVCTEERSKIAGGFALVPITGLMAAWRACRSRPLGIGDFRAWLACHEIKARRCTIDEARDPTFTFAELARLLGVAEKHTRASVRRLVAAGLLQWAESTIGFPGLLLEDEPMVPGLEDSIGRGRGPVAIPRRMLRLLAAGARPALVATTLGILLRCLGRRRRGFDGRGRVKASWVARVFDIDLRGVKAARLELVDLGWIEVEPAQQWSLNRWGRAYRIDLDWDRPGSDGRRLPPPSGADGPSSPPPCLDQEPLRESNQDQEPAGRGPAGIGAKGTGERSDARSGPTLEDVRPEDLKNTGRLLELHRQAVERGLVTASEADRLRFVAAAEHALAIGKGNPPGLFAYLVRGRCWRYSTVEDEDRANARLKAHLRGPGPVPVATPAFRSQPPRGPMISEDARIVGEIRGAMIRAGIYRDPFPAVQARTRDGRGSVGIGRWRSWGSERAGEWLPRVGEDEQTRDEDERIAIRAVSHTHDPGQFGLLASEG